MEPTLPVPPGAGLPSERLPERLRTCLSRLDRKDPLRDGGETIAVLMEAGAQAEARALLDAAWSTATVAGAAARLRCHLLEALFELTQGDRSAARQQLGRALEVPVDLAVDVPLRILRAGVGIQVSLATNDLAESEEFVRDLRESATSESADMLSGNLALWNAELALRKGQIAHADRMIRSLPAGDGADGGSAWRIQRLRGELALFRGDVQGALARLEDANRAMERVAESLPAEYRRGYLDGPARQAMGARLAEIGRKGAASTVLGLPQVAVDAVPTAGLMTTFGALLQGVLDLGRQGNLDALLDRALDAMVRFSDARRGLIVLVDGGAVRVQRARHREHRPLDEDELQLSRSIALRVASDGRPVLLDDASASDEYGQRESVVAYKLRSVLCVPLLLEGQKRGAIYLDDPGREAVFSAGMLDAVQVLATHAALAMEHARLLSRITRDQLTGAYTHAFLHEQIANAVSSAQRHRRSCGLIMVDLDHFKGINDTYGHDFGNEVLRQVARRLQEDVRGSDTVALRRTGTGSGEPAVDPRMLGRFGGDEFEVLLTDTGPDGLRIVAERFLKAIQTLVIRAGDVRVPISASVGGACFPDHARDAQALFRRADEALYTAKRDGRNVFRMAPPEAP